MIEIQLTQNMVAFIDDEDYDLVKDYKWHTHAHRNTYYAQTFPYIKGTGRKGKKHYLSMHRLIIGATQPTQLVDHVNGNGLDNQKENLRFCTNSQNAMNRKQGWGSSLYKGVSYKKATDRWVSRIMLDYKYTYLGSFLSEEAAAKAYDKAAIETYGEFANLNFKEI
jgi:hypothetical protein